MWEWRCFSSTNDFHHVLEQFPQFDGIDWEIRRDTYYEFDDEGFGLKERWNLIDDKVFPKLELKVRLTRNKFGAEYWNKCVEIPFFRDGIIHLNIEEIGQMLKSLRPSSEFCRSGLSEFLPYLDNEFYRVNVAKERKQLYFQKKNSQLTLEYVKGKVEGHYYYGVSIESERPKLVKRYIHDLKLNHENNIMGYPEFVVIHSYQGMPKIT